MALLVPLLRDPVRTVRLDAARALAAAPRESLDPADREALEAGLAEYVESLRLDADRPEARVSLGA